MIDFKTGEVRVPADVWLTVEPLVEKIELASVLFDVGIGTIAHEIYPDPRAWLVVLLARLGRDRYDIVPFRELSASGGGGGTGTAHLSCS
ncbi:hypothetical protein ACM16X_08885 [Haloarcula japonica]|uniref:hypothetical protein n=1 Tax=Haloarcula japonica TaxID=29282 RepID=UPI0039F65ED8